MDKSRFLKSSVLTENKSIRLFCLPYAGGGSSIYYPWIKKFTSSPIEICPIQLPGKEHLINETPFTDMDKLVEFIADYISNFTNEPYAIFGHSLGGLISYEIVKELERRNRELPILLIISAHKPPHIINKHSNMHKLDDSEFIENLKKLNGTSEEVFSHPELLQLLIPGIRADFEILGKYNFIESDPIRTAMSIYTGYEDDYENIDKLLDWKKMAKKSISFTLFQGDHFFPWNVSKEKVIEQIIEDIESRC